MRRSRHLYAILIGAAVLGTAAFVAVYLIAPFGGESDSDTPRSAAAAVVAEPTEPAIRPAGILPISPQPVGYEALDTPLEPLAGARTLNGTYEGGAYLIEVPEAWNGSVVYYSHGFRGNPPLLTVTPPAIREHFVERGFAWAASSYSKNGYEPGVAARDTLALRRVFEERVGAPKRRYIYGESMGGNAVTYALEHEPLAYDGALSECGVVSGHEVLDYFLGWATLAQYFTGIDITSAARLEAGTRVQVFDDLLAALGPWEAPTVAGDRFANVVLHMSGGPRPFFREGYELGAGGNFAILAAAVELAGPSAAAAENVDARYRIDASFGVTSEQLNREIERFLRAPHYRDAVAYPEFAPMSGEIRVPLLTIHTTGDMLVPISLEGSYRRTVEAAGNGSLLVQRAMRRPGHCNFSEAERERAFDDLVAWVERGARPAGEDLRGDLSNAGLAFTEPLEPNDPGGLRP